MDALSPPGAKQTTEMASEFVCSSVSSQIGPLRSAMQEMPLPEYVCGS